MSAVAPAAADPRDWNAFYGGVSAGAAFGDTSVSTVVDCIFGGVLCAPGIQEDNGAWIEEVGSGLGSGIRLTVVAGLISLCPAAMPGTSRIPNAPPGPSSLRPPWALLGALAVTAAGGVRIPRLRRRASAHPGAPTDHPSGTAQTVPEPSRTPVTHTTQELTDTTMPDLVSRALTR